MHKILEYLTTLPGSPDEFIAKMTSLYSFLLEENNKSNLTRITDKEEYWIKHVLDSLLLTEAHPEIIKKGTEIADLGCGGGFPSLVLAAAFPQINITAIDSIGKKTAFVEKAARELGLDNINIITGRGRELGVREEYRRKFDIVTARAVSRASKIFREVRRMLKQNGQIILFKTPTSAEDEICEFRKKHKALELQWNQSKTYVLPEDMGTRVFISLDFANGT